MVTFTYCDCIITYGFLCGELCCDLFNKKGLISFGEICFKVVFVSK